MKNYTLVCLLISVLTEPLIAQNDTLQLIKKDKLEQRNKQIATNFYQDLWFTNNTENYTQYVAETYVAHDIGDRKNVTEPALLGKIMYGAGTIPIINVFRFNEEGKIIEIWNHRHDIDSNMTLKFTIKGFLFGLLIALIPTLIAIRLRRKLKKVRAWEISDN
jgi:predicted SnoaL-like aldol condensation-catalyzing enzyme